MPRFPARIAIATTLCLGLMGLVALRERVVRLAPMTAGAYASLGLPVHLDGLALRRMTSTVIEEGGTPVLAIEGEIANLRAARTDVPQLRLAVAGADGREIYYWTSAAPKPKLDANETVQFRARLAAPPEAGRKVLVRFAAQTDPAAAEKVKAR